MTSRMQGDEPGRVIMISCDGHGCDQCHDNNAIALGGGLHEMGWKMKFNDETRKLMHFCPAHTKGAEA
jgi:hypothetical protein